MVVAGDVVDLVVVDVEVVADGAGVSRSTKHSRTIRKARDRYCKPLLDASMCQQAIGEEAEPADERARIRTGHPILCTLVAVLMHVGIELGSTMARLVSRANAALGK